jgi:hypothetical protein
MGVGLMQLAMASSQINNDIVDNPSISFFNYVFRKHTNFAMVNYILPFENLPSLLTNMHLGNDYYIKLAKPSDIDLLSKVYLVFTLPAIYSDDKFKFKWVENVGALVIKKATIHINNSIIDTITGEWLVIWNELTLPVKDGFNNMTGNIPALNNPRKPETTIRIRNNIVSDYDYLASDGITPSIESRDVIVPLSFWFTKNPSLALPIINGEYCNIINLKIEFENIENLYTVYSDIYNIHVSPKFYNEIHKKKINITNFIKANNFRAYVEATYYVLDSRERASLIDSYKSIVKDYVIENISYISSEFPTSTANSTKTVKINSQLAVKEIIWTLKRADCVDNFNNHLNYSYSIPKNNEKSIMKNAKIIWDKSNPNNRVEDREAYFYNTIQPYEYHSTVPMQGIYLYSFSLYPEKWFPSGFYDGASVTTTLNMTFNPYEKNYLDTIYNKTSYDGSQNKIYCNIYVIQYNILRIISCNIKLKYAN